MSPLTPLEAYSNPRYTPEDIASIERTEVAARSATEAVSHLKREFRLIMESSIERLVPGEKPGLLLSGGVDSALTLALMCDLGYRPSCFTAGAPDSEDVVHAQHLAANFDVDWTICEFTVEELRTSLPRMIRILNYSGLFSVASGLLLETCFKHGRREGITTFWTGNGLDLIFGGGLNRTIVETQSGDSPHEQFWNYTLPRLERWYGRDDPVNLYGTVAASQGVSLEMPFESVRAAIIAREIDGALLYSHGQDKFPLRELLSTYGVTPSQTSRVKDPFQRSSGMFEAIGEAMFEIAPSLIDDAVSHDEDVRDDPYLTMRLFLSLLEARGA